jgi:hypothetical protein
MSKPSLFDDDNRYTPDATELDSLTHHALEDIFTQFVKKGYSPREIAHIMQLSIFDLELDKVL